MKFFKKHFDITIYILIFIAICIIAFIGYVTYAASYNYQEQLAITSGDDFLTNNSY